MSVTIINTKDAIAIAENAQRLTPQVTKTLWKNFFDVFGTTGCLLNCEVKRTLEHKVQDIKGKNDNNDASGVGLARKITLLHFRRSCKEWFTASEITKSAAQGCGSCTAIKQIIRNLFSPNKQDLSGEY